MISSSSIFRIGSIDVHLGMVPFAELAGLRRLPAAAGSPAPQEATPIVELSFAVAEKHDWEIELQCAGNTVIKGLKGHQLTVNFDTGNVAFRIVQAPTPGMWYYVFRDIFCALCALSGNPLLHSSAIITASGGIVFCGHSGAGKSTLARLLREANYASVINDEINWVYLKEDHRPVLVNQQYWMQPRKSAKHPQIPLRSVYAIEQATTCRVKPITPAQAFASLLGVPFGTKDPFLKTRAGETAEMIREVNLGLLEFSLDADAIAEAIGLLGVTRADRLGKVRADLESSAQEAAETKQIKAVPDNPQSPGEE